jgi:hypothetical protein
MAWLLWRRTRKTAAEPVSLDDLPAPLRNTLASVRAAAQRCSAARGNDLAFARRQLAGVLRESMTMLGNQAAAPSIVWFTAEEMWRAARPWLILDVVVTRRSVTTAAMTETQLDMWRRAEEVIAEVRGDDPVVARERLLQLIDELEALSSPLVTAPMSTRQAAMWRLSAEEIHQFAADALGIQGP